MRVGLLGYNNTRGLGIQTRGLQKLLPEVPGVKLSTYEIRAGNEAYRFDTVFRNDPDFMEWIANQECLIVQEIFTPELTRFCRRNYIKTVWIPAHEWIPMEGTDKFQEIDHIITLSHACADFLVDKFKLQNVVRCQWVLPLKTYKSSFMHGGRQKFLMNAGTGGVKDRRNVRVVIDAIPQVQQHRDDIEFILKTQLHLSTTPPGVKRLEGEWSYRKVLKLYRKADFSIAPSKWEGCGFALLESLYNGTPVLTVDAPPMNEWVKHKVTGYLCPVTYEKGLNWVRAAVVNPSDLVKGINWLADNQEALYESFDRVNTASLDARRANWLKTWSGICS